MDGEWRVGLGADLLERLSILLLVPSTCVRSRQEKWAKPVGGDLNLISMFN